MKKFLFVLLTALILFSGCDNDTTNDNHSGGGGGGGGVVDEGKKTKSDLTLLRIKKTEAESLKEGVVIATNAQEVAQGRKWVTKDEMFTFEGAISKAFNKISAVTSDQDWLEDTSQSAVNNTVTDLSEAITAFIKLKKDGNKSSGFTKEEILKLIEDAKAAQKGVQTSSDGADIDPKDSWVIPVVMSNLNDAITKANSAAYNLSVFSDPIDTAYLRLVIAMRDFYLAKQQEFRHTISINDLDSFYYLKSNNLDIMIGLFSTADIYEDTEPLCFGYNYNIYNSYISGVTSSVTVYLINKSDYNLWHGNGQYYVGLLLNTSNGNSFYRSNTQVTFSDSNSKQTISFSEFTQVSNRNNSFNPANVTTLTANTWADGNLPSLNSEQWFKFTATDDIQYYIHANFGTMKNMNVQLYDSNGNNNDNSFSSTLHSGNKYTTWHLTIVGQEYYIKVTPSNSYFNDTYYGTYQIAFNTSSTASSILTVLPSNAATLTPNNWVDGNIPTSSGEQWFKFTAAATTQYIHAAFGTLENLYVQLYDNSGISVGSQTWLYNSAKNTSWSLTGGQYYVKVSSYSSSESGTYRIVFNTSATAPIPANAIALNPNIWSNGNLISASNEQWFKFTAAADTHYIHAVFGTLENLYVQLYDKNGNTVGSRTFLSGDNKYTFQSSLTLEQEYYIQVTSNNSSGGAYRITFNKFSSPPIQLTTGTWTDGNITTSSGEQWFYFTATNNTQYIHTGFGTLDSYSGLNVQLYDSKGDAVESRTRLYNSVKNTSRSLTNKQEYYIKVTPYNSSGSGAYRIAFNASATSPSTVLPSNATALTLNFWVDGNIPASSGEQWFKFTATADTHYIHANFGAISSLTVQLYDNSGDSTVGSGSVLNNDNKYISRPSLTIGQVYYIKVTPNSGTGAYQIVFSTSSTAPIVPIWLNSGLWFDGNIPTSNDEQWFKFTATDASQYIHVKIGTLEYLNVQVYNSSGAAVGERTTLSNSTKNISRSLTIGQVYYIKVTPSSGSGAYQIAFNASVTAPPVVIQLVAGLWVDGNIPATNGEQWFKFTATADTQYIHVNFGTLSNLNVQLYNNSGYSVGDKAVLSSNTKNISRSLTIGQEYYIKVTPNSGSGAYQIMFYTSYYVPSLPVQLTADVWANNTSFVSTQWFKFIATADTHYIHVRFSTANSMNVQLYDSNGVTFGDQTALGSSIKYISRSSLTIGQMYYIKVTPYSGSSGVNYQITFNTSTTAPLPTNVTSLSDRVWADGSIPTSSGEQWFKFTATKTLQYIHVSFGTLSNLNVQVYDSSGNTVGNQSHLEYSSNKYTSISRSSLNTGQVYYIQVTPYSGSGNYQITFSSSSSTPGNEMSNSIQLSAGVWVDGYIPNLGGEQWFKFTATNNTQYIYINFTASTSLYVQMYDSGNNPLFTNEVSFKGNEKKSVSRSLTDGQEYYIRVRRSNAYDNVTSVSYKITFNASATEPPIITNAIKLTANIWANDNNNILSGEQWFKFTATAETQYIHIRYGTLDRIWIQLYDNGGNKVGNRTELSTSRAYISQTLTVGQDYYINITPYNSSYSGTYKITFNASSTAPSTGAEADPIPLTADTWIDGNITSTTSGNAIWYSFIVTSGETYYVWWNDSYNGDSSKTLDVKVSAYLDGSSIANINFSGVDAAWNSPKSFKANSNYTVKLKVEPLTSGNTGTFAIVYSMSNTRP